MDGLHPGAGKLLAQRLHLGLRFADRLLFEVDKGLLLRREAVRPFEAVVVEPPGEGLQQASSWWCSPSSPALSGNEKSRPIPFGRLFFVITLQV